MPLPMPPLDDRHFQDIVDQAKLLIPHYCREWTDHNVSDPGVTLIELFAWMTDMLLYRVNQVPEKNYYANPSSFPPWNIKKDASQATTVLYPIPSQVHLADPVSRLMVVMVARQGTYNKTKNIIESADSGVIPDVGNVFCNSSDPSSSVA